MTLAMDGRTACPGGEVVLLLRRGRDPSRADGPWAATAGAPFTARHRQPNWPAGPTAFRVGRWRAAVGGRGPLGATDPLGLAGEHSPRRRGGLAQPLAGAADGRPWAVPLSRQPRTGACLGCAGLAELPAYLGPTISLCYWQTDAWRVADNPAPGSYPVPPSRPGCECRHLPPR
jgi:hypothetical protein